MQLITFWPVVVHRNKTFTAFRWNLYRQGFRQQFCLKSYKDFGQLLVNRQKTSADVWLYIKNTVSYL